MTITDTIFDEIDTVIIESQIDVFEAMCNVYDKAYDILEWCENEDCLHLFNVVQESGDEANADNDKGTKQGNILVRMLRAITGFFKMIGGAVAGIFSKNKAKTTDQLRIIVNKSDAACENAQKNIDNSKASKKIDDMSVSFEKNAASLRNDNDGTSSDEKPANDEESKDNKTGIIVAGKKIKTHIKFDVWIKFLEYSNEWSKSVIRDASDLGSDPGEKPSKGIRLKGVNDSDRKSLRDKFFEFIDEGKNIKRSRFQKKKMFTVFCKKYDIADVADYIDKINDLLDKNIQSAKAAHEKFAKLTEMMSHQINDPTFKTLSKKITDIHTELGNIAKIVLALAKYIGMELNLYDSMLKVIIPMFDEIKKEEKEAEREKKTVYVKVDKSDNKEDKDPQK